MRILILGGTSFIGPAAVRRLLARGHEVTVFHRGRTNAPLPPEVRHMHGDRKDLDAFADEFRRLSPDVVLDMAAYNESAGEKLIRFFAGIARRLVVVSSADVYRAYDRLRRVDPGPPDPAPLTEDAPLRDCLFPYREENTPQESFVYSYEKILMERAAMNAPQVLPATVLRLPMVYGPGDYQHRLYSYLKRMDDGRPFLLLAEEYAAHHGLRGYVEDMGEAIALCVADDSAAGRIYHVAEAGPSSEIEWVRRIAKAANWGGNIVTVPNEQLPEAMQLPYDLAQDWSLDSSRIRSELGYREVTPPDEALRRTIEWERANPPPKIDPADYDYAAEDAFVSSLASRDGVG